MNLLKLLLFNSILLLSIVSKADHRYMYICVNGGAVTNVAFDQLRSISFEDSVMNINYISGEFDVFELAAMRSLVFSEYPNHVKKLANKEGQMHIYPVQSNMLHFEFPQIPTNDVETVFFDMKGTHCCTLIIPADGSKSFDVQRPFIPVGIYLVRANFDGKIYSAKYILNR